MCSHTKHLQRYQHLPSNSYYNKSARGGFLEKHEEGRAQTKRERWRERERYLYTYTLKTIRCNISEEKKQGRKYIIYHCIIRKSRQPNQGAEWLFFALSSKEGETEKELSASCRLLGWNFNGNNRVSDGISSLLIFPIIWPYLPSHRSKLMVLFQHRLFITAQREPKGKE